jgi:hypothetical protein
MISKSIGLYLTHTQWTELCKSVLKKFNLFINIIEKSNYFKYFLS